MATLPTSYAKIEHKSKQQNRRRNEKNAKAKTNRTLVVRNKYK